ncbi:MAG: hypothetical protein IE937_10225, partial [Gammaproteobacteria bacterium]|nr:hypothetical protein [Gammaproteobacteria bacterium]
MKILVVSPTPSHPPTAGNRRRIQALATALRERGAHLSFLYYAREDIDSRTYNDLKSFWDEFYLVQTGQMYTPPPADHFRVDDWVTRPLSETFLSTVREKEFDAVIINYVMLSSLSELVDDRTLTILDTHDVFAGRDEMLRGMGRKPDFFWTSLEEEAKGLVRQDVVLAIQNREAEYFKTAANEVLLVGHMEPQRPYKGGVRDDI